jgi:hypothetical protein
LRLQFAHQERREKQNTCGHIPSLCGPLYSWSSRSDRGPRNLPASAFSSAPTGFRVGKTRHGGLPAFPVWEQYRCGKSASLNPGSEDMGSLPAPKAISPLTAARKPPNRVGAGAADGLVPALVRKKRSVPTQPPSRAHIHDASRRVRISSQLGIRQAECVCARWVGPGPTRAPADRCLKPHAASPGYKYLVHSRMIICRWRSLNGSKKSRHSRRRPPPSRPHTEFAFGARAYLPFSDCMHRLVTLDRSRLSR